MYAFLFGCAELIGECFLFHCAHTFQLNGYRSNREIEYGAEISYKYINGYQYLRLSLNIVLSCSVFGSVMPLLWNSRKNIIYGTNKNIHCRVKCFDMELIHFRFTYFKNRVLCSDDRFHTIYTWILNPHHPTSSKAYLILHTTQILSNYGNNFENVLCEPKHDPSNRATMLQEP